MAAAKPPYPVFCVYHVVKLKGKATKILGDGSGMFSVKASKNDIPLTKENEWIDCGRIASNYPSEIIFTLPKNIEPGLYKFVIKTFINASCNLTKKPSYVVPLLPK